LFVNLILTFEGDCMFNPSTKLFPVGPYSINGDHFLYYEGKQMNVFGMNSYTYFVNGISFVEEKVEDVVRHYVIIHATACFNKRLDEKIPYVENSPQFKFLKWEEYKNQLKEWVCKEDAHNKWVNRYEVTDSYFKKYVN